MKKKLKDIPKFKNEDEEREFWWTHDSTEYVDWDTAQIAIFPKSQTDNSHDLVTFAEFNA